MTRWISVFFTMMLLVATSTAVNAQQDEGPTSEAELPNQTYESEPGAESGGEPSTQAIPSGCFGFVTAWKTGQAVSAQSNLNCSSSYQQRIELELWECDWGWSAYCGGMDFYTTMVPGCSGGGGSLWCPLSGAVTRSVGSDDCYMARAFFTHVDARGTHTGFANSEVLCFG